MLIDYPFVELSGVTACPDLRIVKRMPWGQSDSIAEFDGIHPQMFAWTGLSLFLLAFRAVALA